VTLSEQYPAEMLPVRVVPLTQGQYAVIDPEDWPAVSQYKWCALKTTNTWYAVRGQKNTNGKWRLQYLHTFLTGFTETDHVNTYGLVNRRCNLRPAEGMNSRNTWSSRNGASKYKGVSLTRNKKSWSAFIWNNGATRYLGTFTNEVDAAQAYDEAARSVAGKHARYNFPQPGEQPALRPQAARDGGTGCPGAVTGP
jgi:hypothetical protein